MKLNIPHQAATGAKVGIRMTADHLPQLHAAMEALVSQQVLVGIPESKTVRRPDPDEPSNMTNAAIGYVMEHGSPAQNIPARPFLGPGVAASAKVLGNWLENTARKALAGDLSAVERGLHSTGLAAQAAVRGKITAGPFEPLSPRTIKKRRAKGRTGTKPLIDTSQMRNAVNYVIRPTPLAKRRKG